MTVGIVTPTGWKDNSYRMSSILWLGILRENRSTRFKGAICFQIHRMYTGSYLFYFINENRSFILYFCILVMLVAWHTHTQSHYPRTWQVSVMAKVQSTRHIKCTVPFLGTVYKTLWGGGGLMQKKERGEKNWILFFLFFHIFLLNLGIHGFLWN